MSLCLAGLGWSKPAHADEFLGTDKTLHFGAALGLAAGGYAISGLVLEQPWQRSLAGASLALSAGAAKEFWDWSGHGDPSWNDMAWDAIGAAVGVGLVLCVDLVLRGEADGAGPKPSSAQKSQARLQLRW